MSDTVEWRPDPTFRHAFTAMAPRGEVAVSQRGSAARRIKGLRAGMYRRNDMDITKDMPPCTFCVGGHQHYKLLTPNRGDVTWRSGAWLISVNECDKEVKQRYTFIAANEYHAIAGMFSDILATMKLADGPTAGSA